MYNAVTLSLSGVMSPQAQSPQQREAECVLYCSDTRSIKPLGSGTSRKLVRLTIAPRRRQRDGITTRTGAASSAATTSIAKRVADVRGGTLAAERWESREGDRHGIGWRHNTQGRLLEASGKRSISLRHLLDLGRYDKPAALER